MNEEICKNCKWFEKFIKADDNGGWCNRFPPTVISDGEGDPQSETPSTFEYNFCGEFLKKKDNRAEALAIFSWNMNNNFGFGYKTNEFDDWYNDIY